MPNTAPRSIVVIDVGATNAKVVQIGPDLTIMQDRSVPVAPLDGGLYQILDSEAVLNFASAAILDFDRRTSVDAIVPCTHGSALALLTADGELALPMMSYLARVPDDIAQIYDTIAPAFDEVRAPTNPGALTLGRQLLWQETYWPDAFAQVDSILPYAQYIAFRLCGVRATEVSAMGAQTHLWAPEARAYSSLARVRGWDSLFPPMRAADDVLGQIRDMELTGRGDVLCGVHDSNANYVRYLSGGPMVLLSTGTWIIAFDSDGSIMGLDGARDQVSNTTVSGAPVACARFMGGEEYARIAGRDNPHRASVAGVAALVRDGVMALPSFTDSGGPVPHRGGRGEILGTSSIMEEALANLATLYTAQMTSVALDALGRTEKVVVDGPFATNIAFLQTLCALMPGRRILRALEAQGTALGSASLAIGAAAPEPRIDPVATPDIPGLEAYHHHWMAAAIA
ncbi:hypothetical protein JQU17_00545 [Ponticoccus sp. SC2-23]|nr:hypothetical protein [Ponticoccus sp. SC6-9]MBM1224261.1 hypothetical protein [Ponticoccus sp. SC6-15]MBM1229960.1 hypothetical protein [Ponticoccus sp. SC6-38]MBM1233227.1 hypothetical protein [Ponticoccus sp. SC6-45]MBM1236823.1 hypothetical protein [Ponticoccus sp. SC6-49]MBM1242238.1 hypothetical protein [Ponticoccus sp. SC2-64]MBM1246751.1 hypothetical protein [Ponticoccus sp. SC6-42]MBM1251229.1 hypothetical protein [Ponticoccus sp. SC6-33]MBM1254832.1 hypothetical protein [Pontico